MTELFIKRGVLVVAHLDHPVVNAECVAKVDPCLMSPDLDNPVVEVLAIEEREPFLAIGCVLSAGGDRAQTENCKEALGQNNRKEPAVSYHVAGCYPGAALRARNVRTQIGDRRYLNHSSRETSSLYPNYNTGLRRGARTSINYLTPDHLMPVQ